MEDILLTDDEKRIKYEARKIVKEIPHELIREIEREEVKFPREFIEEIASKHAAGLRFPVEYGGRDATWVAEMSAVEEMGYLGFTLSCMYSLGSIVGEPVNKFGTKEQKEKYLKGITSGKRYGAEAITEPTGGSDLFGMMRTRAVKSGSKYILNGQKRFVVGGSGADFFVTYAITDPGAKPITNGITAFVVDRESAGLKVETVYGLMGTRGGGTARIIYRDVELSEESVIGELNHGYDVFNVMMVPERLTTAAGSLGVAMAAIEIATDYAMKREAFGKKLIDHEGVNFKIAESLTAIQNASSLVYAASRAADLLEQKKVSLSYVRKLVSMSKLNSTEVMWKTVNDAMQIMGGIGYTTIYPVERLLRDSRLGMIWTGTNEVMKMIIQHEFVKEIKDPAYFSTRRNVQLDALDFDLVEEKVYG
ncbi:MAG: acyl-CoA dehydrogenase [Thaumarchaeota archaeon]|nr:acyl-CoA dehydrogenase [Nitrososphaerota archaeon]MDG6932545.1 acyl-CoA dehydrogenase [Nitrososphaerota archaeon]